MGGKPYGDRDAVFVNVCEFYRSSAGEANAVFLLVDRNRQYWQDKMRTPVDWRMLCRDELEELALRKSNIETSYSRLSI